MPDDAKDPKVKDLIEQSVTRGEPLEELVDAITAQQLEKWFGLPSFTQVEQGEVKISDAQDADIAAVRARREKAIEAVDPALLDLILNRFPTDLLNFQFSLEQHVDPDFGLFDREMFENKMQIAEPREYERPADIEDQLKDATPQAMLRDLHRPETEFWKQFDVVDVAAEQRLDGSAEVATAMTTNWKLPVSDMRHAQDMRLQLTEARDERNRPWRDIPTRVKLPNRRVAE